MVSIVRTVILNKAFNNKALCIILGPHMRTLLLVLLHTFSTIVWIVGRGVTSSGEGQLQLLCKPLREGWRADCGKDWRHPVLYWIYSLFYPFIQSKDKIPREECTRAGFRHGKATFQTRIWIYFLAHFFLWQVKRNLWLNYIVRVISVWGKYIYIFFQKCYLKYITILMNLREYYKEIRHQAFKVQDVS